MCYPAIVGGLSPAGGFSTPAVLHPLFRLRSPLPRFARNEGGKQNGGGQQWQNGPEKEKNQVNYLCKA